MAKAPSNFHFVINSNVPANQLISKGRQFRLELINKLKDTSVELRDNIGRYCRNAVICPQLTNFTANLEVGPQKKMLHIDGYMSFSGYTQLDFKRITDLFNSRLAGYSSGVYLNVQYVHDSVRVVQIYSAKDGNSLV